MFESKYVFRSGRTAAFVKDLVMCDELREELTISVSSGRSSSRHSFNRNVGIGSIRYGFDGEYIISLRISSSVAGSNLFKCL